MIQCLDRSKKSCIQNPVVENMIKSTFNNSKE